MQRTESHGLNRVVDWLRAGYPHGIPREDYVVLFGILQRSLTATEVEEIARELHERGAGGGSVADAEIADLIQQTVLQHASEADVRRVAGRLAEGGWPLEALTATQPPSPRRGLLPGLERAVTWLRQGYPTGIPATDFIPVLALLKRRLSEEELVELIDHLRAAGFIPADRLAVASAYMAITDELAEEDQLNRVIQRLRAAGVEFEDTTQSNGDPS